MKLAVLGAGMVGSLIAQDLSTNHSVTVFDVDINKLEPLAKKGIFTVKADLSDVGIFPNLLQGFDLVACAVPGFMGFKTLEAIINAGKDVVDISFSPENLLDLDGLAKEKKVTAIVDCGVAPGMSNLILGYWNAQMDIQNFKCMVGGLPKNPQPPYFYKAPFSPIDVIEEYTRPARIMREGQVVTLPALSEMETVAFEQTGNLDCFNTDGLRSILSTMPHIPNMVEKTLRYPGHIQEIVKLKESGYFSEELITIEGIVISPLAETSKKLIKEWKLGENEPELTIMKIIIEGRQNKEPKRVEYLLYDERDANGNSSMSRTTAFTCTACVNLLADGVFGEKGVFPPELIGGDEHIFNYVIKYLKQRKVVYQQS